MPPPPPEAPPFDDRLREHLANGYARTRRYERIALGVGVGGLVLIALAAVGVVVQMGELGFLDPEIDGLTRVFRDVYVATSGMLLAILAGVSLFGLAVRAAARARRAALDAAVLTSGLPEHEKAALLFGE